MRLPERIDGERLLLRRWRVEDAAAQQRAVEESAEHLRPWMAWMGAEPQARQQRREMLAGWEAAWRRGGDAHYAVLLDGRVVGSCGLHTRLGPRALEIGYWIHAQFVRQGLATEAARMLTDAAFQLAHIDRVEIHHDEANVASSGVPRRLGYRFVWAQRDRASAPADTGIECIWRIERDEWAGTHT